MKLFDSIRQRYQAWQDRRFLKRHHCDSWAQYHRHYDPAISRGSSYIRNWYRGYSYVHCFESYDHYAYRLLYDYGPGGVAYGSDEINQWCADNCEGKYRGDVHEVVWDDWGQDWYSSGIAGRDRVFFAFQESRDYLFFSLRWS